VLLLEDLCSHFSGSFVEFAVSSSAHEMEERQAAPCEALSTEGIEIS
jgi:hypothetical protein